MVKYNRLVSMGCMGALLLSTHSIANIDNSIRRSDFTHSTELRINMQEGFVTLAIPYEVLKYSQRKDFGDIRIFNEQGQQVPHSFLSRKTIVYKEQKQLTFFPIYATKEQNLNDVKIHINTNSDGQVIDIMSNNKGKENSEKIAYIIENKISKHFLKKINIDWQGESENSIRYVSLEQSDDLVHWRSLVSKVALSKLNYGGQVLKKTTFKIPYTKTKYLRLQETGRQKIFNLQSITATYYSSKDEVKIESKIFSLEHYAAKKNSSEFNSHAYLPIISAELVGMQKNVLYQGLLYTRDSEKESWQHFSAFNQYHLQINNTVLNSNRISVNQQQHRQWLWEFTAPVPLAATQLPQVTLRWEAKQLVFLSQGTGVYFLMVGHSQAPLIHNNVLQLYRTLGQRESQATQQIKPAEPDKNPFLIIAPKVEAPFPWKKVVLWLVLVVGVLFMITMAFRLFKQIEREKV